MVKFSTSYAQSLGYSNLSVIVQMALLTTLKEEPTGNQEYSDELVCASAKMILLTWSGPPEINRDKFLWIMILINY